MTIYIGTIHYSSSSYAHHLLCACWHSEAVKGPSSLSSRRLLISPQVTSSHCLCPEPTDAPYPCYEEPAPLYPKWRPYPQGPHTLPFQGPTHVQLVSYNHCRHSIIYTRRGRLYVHDYPLAPLVSLLHLLGTLLVVTGSVHLVPRLLVN
jgi:hypothetical protein